MRIIGCGLLVMSAAGLLITILEGLASAQCLRDSEHLLILCSGPPPWYSYGACFVVGPLGWYLTFHRPRSRGEVDQQGHGSPMVAGAHRVITGGLPLASGVLWQARSLVQDLPLASRDVSVRVSASKSQPCRSSPRLRNSPPTARSSRGAASARLTPPLPAGRLRVRADVRVGRRCENAGPPGPGSSAPGFPIRRQKNRANPKQFGDVT